MSPDAGGPGTGPRAGAGQRTLLTGWFSFLHGEATAGDVLALRRVERELRRSGGAYDVAWSPRFHPGGLSLEDADPRDYGRLLFVCGPLHGGQLEWLHRRFADCVRIAVGTSVLDPGSAAVAGFHRVVARDGPGDRPAVLDLAASAPEPPSVPVAGVVLTGGQREYGADRRHQEVADAVTGWLGRTDCARLELDTRLDARDWRLCATAAQYMSVVRRLDVVVTSRLHGLVLALRAGVPALAVDPVRGGAKVSAQARACRWPALVTADRLAGGGAPREADRTSAGADAELDRWWGWCLGPGRGLAECRAEEWQRLRPRLPDRDLLPEEA